MKQNVVVAALQLKVMEVIYLILLGLV